MRLALALLIVLLATSLVRAEAQSCDYKVSILNNASPSLSVSDVLDKPDAFAPLPNGASGFFEGRSETQVFWLKFEPVSPRACAGPLWMHAKYPYLNDVALYTLGDDAARPGEVSQVPSLPLQYPVWPLTEDANEPSQTYLLRIDYPDRLILPYKIASPARIASDISAFGLISASLVVLFLALAVQAGALGRLLSRTDTAAFVGFAVFSAVYVFISSGLLGVVIHPARAFDTRYLLLTSQAVLVWTAVDFLRANIRTSTSSAADRGFQALQYAAIPTILSPYLAPAADGIAFLFAFTIAPILILLLLCHQVMQGKRRAWGLLLAWTPTILATVWIYGRLLGITPYHPINHHLIGIGLFLTALRFNTFLAITYRGEARAARHDPLTGLPNRRALNKTARRFEDKGLGIGALAIMDLRKFKTVNDTYGHAAGDQVLMQLSQRVNRILPKGAGLYRIGGDEFVLMIEDILDGPAIKRLLIQVSVIAAQPINYMGERVGVAANIGAVLGPIPDGVSFSSVMSAADKLAYSAKSSRRSDVLALRWADVHAQETKAGPLPLNAGHI